MASFVGFFWYNRAIEAWFHDDPSWDGRQRLAHMRIPLGKVSRTMLVSIELSVYQDTQ